MAKVSSESVLGKFFLGQWKNGARSKKPKNQSSNFYFGKNFFTIHKVKWMKKKGGGHGQLPMCFGCFFHHFCLRAAPLRCVVEVFGPSRQWCVGWIVGQEPSGNLRGKPEWQAARGGKDEGNMISGWWQLKYFLFSPLFGEDSHLTNIFQMGWNHQPDLFWVPFFIGFCRETFWFFDFTWRFWEADYWSQWGVNCLWWDWGKWIGPITKSRKSIVTWPTTEDVLLGSILTFLDCMVG